MKVHHLNLLEPCTYHLLRIENNKLLYDVERKPDVICEQFLIEGHGMLFFGNKVGWVDPDGYPIKDSVLKERLLRIYTQQDLDSNQLRADVESLGNSLQKFIEAKNLFLFYLQDECINEGTFYILDSPSKVTAGMIPSECFRMLAKVLMNVRLTHSSGIDWYVNLVVDVDHDIRP